MVCSETGLKLNSVISFVYNFKDFDHTPRTTSHVTTTWRCIKTIWEQQTFFDDQLFSFVDVYDNTKTPTTKEAIQCCSGKICFCNLGKTLEK